MSEKQVKHIGIDYGSKLAGTTVICFLNESGKVEITQSAKKQDADNWILKFIEQHPINYVFLDAPLSLPKVYSDSAENGNYFYREADKITKAMSPMFLGGLTARAMKLKSQLSISDIITKETYPKLLMQELSLETYYKKDITKYLTNFLARTNIEVGSEITNWHQADALLAYFSGSRFLAHEHIEIGDESEGTIIF